MNRLIDKNNMFDHSRTSQRFQRLIALPGLHDNAIVRSNAEIREAQPCTEVVCKKRNIGYCRTLEKNSKSYKPLNSDSANEDTINIKMNNDNQLGSVVDIIPEKKLQSNNIIAKPKQPSAQVSKLIKTLNGDQSSSRDMSESNDVVHELLEIVYTERKLDSQINEEAKRSEQIQSSEDDTYGSIISTRLKAVVENWKNDDAFALSSKDSWTLKRNKIEDDSFLPIHLMKNVASKVSRPIGSEINDEQVIYQAQIPIRQRLRESWRSKEEHKQISEAQTNAVTNGIKPGISKISKGPKNTNFHAKKTSFSSHLLPHPNDLLFRHQASNDLLFRHQTSNDLLFRHQTSNDLFRHQTSKDLFRHQTSE